MGFTIDNPKRLSDVLKYDIPTYSRDHGVVASGQGKLEIGTVLGLILLGAASVLPKSGGNTGTGLLTMDGTTPLLAGAQLGTYTARFIAAAANGGTFRLEAPNGAVLGDFAVGATVADGIKFAIADGATDFVVGDGFDITIAAGSKKFARFDPAATNGAQLPYGILGGPVDATSADAKAMVVARHAELGAAGVVWPVGITAPQKAAALAHLDERRGIVVRQSA